MIDRDLPLKQEIAKNIKKLMKKYSWTQIKLSEVSGISKSTLSDYINCKTLISPGNVEKLSEAFNVHKSDIDPSFKSTIEEASALNKLTAKDERDIQKELQKMIDDLNSKNSYAAFGGQSLNDLDDEDRELLIASLENSLRIAKRIAKEKFTPKKYK